MHLSFGACLARSRRGGVTSRNTRDRYHMTQRTLSSVIFRAHPLLYLYHYQGCVRLIRSIKLDPNRRTVTTIPLYDMDGSASTSLH